MSEHLLSWLHLQKQRFLALTPAMRWLIAALLIVIMVIAGIGSLLTTTHHHEVSHVPTSPVIKPRTSSPSGTTPPTVKGKGATDNNKTGSAASGSAPAPKDGASSSSNGSTNAGTSKNTGGTSSSISSSGGSPSGGSSSPQTMNCAPKPSACGFPDATNTGPSGCVSYTSMNGNAEITTDGTVISCVRLTGSLDVYANNVTIENSIITSSYWWGVNLRSGYTGLKVLYSTITGSVGNGPDNGGEDYAVSNGSDGSIEVGYSNISEFGDAISLGNGNIHDNYVHDLQAYIPLCGSSPCSYYEHTDDLISDGSDSAGLMVEHNTMLNQLSTAQGASAAIGLFADNGPVSNTTVDDNLIAGGSYVLYPGGGSTSSNIVITNNHFSTLYWPQGGYYGADATSYWHSGSGNQWSGNIWDDGSSIGQTISP